MIDPHQPSSLGWKYSYRQASEGITMKRFIFIAVLCLLVSGVNAATFKGYQCTQDCSGHIAGYKWAMRKGITGKSRSFVEGCYAWVDEQKNQRES
jgi:hypothetical protein